MVLSHLQWHTLSSAVKLTLQGKLEELESKALDSASDCAECDRWVSMRDPISLKGLGVSNSDEISTDLYFLRAIMVRSYTPTNTHTHTFDFYDSLSH